MLRVSSIKTVVKVQSACLQPGTVKTMRCCNCGMSWDLWLLLHLQARRSSIQLLTAVPGFTSLSSPRWRGSRDQTLLVVVVCVLDLWLRLVRPQVRHEMMMSKRETIPLTMAVMIEPIPLTMAISTEPIVRQMDSKQETTAPMMSVCGSFGVRLCGCMWETDGFCVFVEVGWVVARGKGFLS